MRRVVDMVAFAKLAIKAGLYTLQVACGAAIADQQTTIGQNDCATGVHLVARSAPLPEVLSRLSGALDFQLQLIGSSDTIIDVDATKQAPELIAKLSPVDNLIVAQERDPRCPGHFRVAKVWLLSKGSSAEGLARSAVTSPVSRQLSDAEKLQNRENDNAYRKAHGMPPLAD